jgi:serine/threonine-protein kinase
MQGTSEESPSGGSPLVIGRYAIYDAIASGGMATVHLGRLIGPAGFLRTVAVKRLHPQYASDPEFSSMLLDEARLAARIHHPNVVSTLDVVVAEEKNELLLVMEYIRGDSLSKLVRRARTYEEAVPPRVACAIIAGVLYGLHAAHEAHDEKGKPLGLIHRDVSPQNILVGADGVARVLDFGIAKAEGRVHSTKDGDIKGKVLYMPPEQLAAEPLNRTADIYAVGVVLYEALTGQRMFAGENERAALSKIIQNKVRMPSETDPALAVFDLIVRRATRATVGDRYPTAMAMARELEGCVQPASVAEVAEWVQRLAGEVLDERAKLVAEIERSTTRSKPPTRGPEQSLPDMRTPASLPRPNLDAPTMDASFTPPPMSGSQPASRPDIEEPKSRTPMVVFVLIVLFVLIGSLAVAVFFAMREKLDAITSAPPPPAAVSAPVVALPSVTAADPLPPPTGAGGSTAASATATATASARPSATVQRIVPPPQQQQRVNVGPAVNCDPPYTVDKNGHRHFIPECMK